MRSLLPFCALGAHAQFPRPPAPRYHYGDPGFAPCLPGEINVTLPGVAGKFCSPPCSAAHECPNPLLANASDAPPGTNCAGPKIVNPVIPGGCTPGTDCEICPGSPLYTQNLSKLLAAHGTVRADCVIEKGSAAPGYCAMVCNPAAPPDFRVPGTNYTATFPRSGCPGGKHPLRPGPQATCAKVETIGVCTYEGSAAASAEEDAFAAAVPAASEG